MVRFSLFALIGTISISHAASATPPDDAVSKHLSVQTAMSVARSSLADQKPQKAVEALEDQLPNVNGNPQFLVLLRAAYRAYICELYLNNQPELAKRYHYRLCILDPAAANDPALKPQTETAPRAFRQEPIKAEGLKLPKFTGFPFTNPFARKDAQASQLLKPEIRAQMEDTSIEDPFDRRNQREMPIDQASAPAARDLLLRGMNEFSLKRYHEAKALFEQAYRADQSTLTSSREPWAYCIIDSVYRQMEQPGALPDRLPDLQKQVEGAIEMAPGKVMATGKSLLAELDRRAARPASAKVAVSVKHWGQNKEGWQVAETQNFRIFHKENKEFAERAAQVAENTRVAMFRKWFGNDGIEWQPICELILHPNVSSYTQMTGAPDNSPGHSRIDADKVSKRVVSRRLDLRCDIATMMEAVLPHETTHAVLSGMFGPYYVPRWADEGMAVLSEPNDKIELHRRNLLKHLKDGELFGLKELMEMENYPHPRRIGAFYSQSVVLVEFLTQQRGPKTFADFIKDGLRHGYETSLQKHYSLTFSQLEQNWQQQVINNPQRVSARQ